MKAPVYFGVLFALIASNSLIAATPSNSSQNPQSGWQLVNRSEPSDKPKYNDSAAHAIPYGDNQGQVSDSGSYSSQSKTTTATTATTSTATVSDRDLKGQLQAQFAQDPAAKNVKVTVSNSKVTLDGFVANAADSKKIEAAAKRFNGVASVTNKLTVQSPK